MKNIKIKLNLQIAREHTQVQQKKKHEQRRKYRCEMHLNYPINRPQQINTTTNF